MNAIHLADLRIAFGDQTVLDGIDLSVPAGSVLALLGPNGAGKTTLINILSTLVRPDHGRAEVCGHDVVTEGAAVRRRISVTGQQSAVDPVLSGAENLQLIGRLTGLSGPVATATTRRLIEQFDLVGAADRRVATYSGGMRRRLDLALGLVGAPEVIFLDEPTTGLDPVSRQDLWAIIGDLAHHGVTILLTTQYLEEADKLADQVALIDRGRIVASGTPGELKALVGNERLELRRTADDTVLAAVAVDGTPTSLRRALDQLEAAAEDSYVVLRRPTLDDVFRQLTSRAALAEVA